jgi:hypothetical protein
LPTGNCTAHASAGISLSLVAGTRTLPGYKEIDGDKGNW